MEGTTEIPLPDGVILAGGAGRRMGGCDKGLLPLAGRPLAAHVAAVLRPHCVTLWIAARDAAPYRAIGDAVVEDGPWAGAGPLAGILAALAVTRARVLLVAPCDAPFLPMDLPQRLLQGLCGKPAVYAHDGERAHYACAALRTDLAPAMQDCLARGERSLQGFFHAVGARPTTCAAPPGAFRNLNTPADLIAAEQICLS